MCRRVSHSEIDGRAGILRCTRRSSSRFRSVGVTFPTTQALRQTPSLGFPLPPDARTCRLYRDESATVPLHSPAALADEVLVTLRGTEEGETVADRIMVDVVQATLAGTAQLHGKLMPDLRPVDIGSLLCHLYLLTHPRPSSFGLLEPDALLRMTGARRSDHRYVAFPQ